ncbi:MAG TPA: hypothetical protein VG755_19850, partial [Nannocystaceae bacterium]|nr:hypothetical protein [Nannocystaceae bacterium]
MSNDARALAATREAAGAIAGQRRGDASRQRCGPTATQEGYDADAMELAVGKDIFGVCGKCGDTWHVIVSLEGKKVTKVQCKFCSGYHRFKRSPNDPAPPPSAPQKTQTAAVKAAARA